eukprot:COSAG04_NODE_2926_length_3377_cov_6.370958_4_plen_52_part_00
MIAVMRRPFEASRISVAFFRSKWFSHHRWVPAGVGKAMHRIKLLKAIKEQL